VRDEVTTNTSDATRPFRSADFLQRKLPYAAVLTLAVLGVAYTNISQQPLVGYWEFLAVATGVLCVVTEWKNAEDRQARFRLMWKQALHWAAILVTMNILLLSGVRIMLPAPANGIVLLTLLALGTFLAGVSLSSLEICFLGVAMVIAVPAIAWLKQSLLFLVLAVILLVGLALAFWPRARPRKDSPDNL
jgi:hypothetical protein